MEEGLAVSFFSVFGFVIFGFIIFIIIYLSKIKELSLELDNSTGRITLKMGKKIFNNFSRSDIAEICLSSYSTGSKNQTTYYTYAIVLTEEAKSRLIKTYPELEKASMDLNGYRVFSDISESKTRIEAEKLAKLANLPIRSRDGSLRQPSLLDVPFHIAMKDQENLMGFPPRYREGDYIEITESLDGLKMRIHKKSQFLIPGSIMLLLPILGFFVMSQSWELFFQVDEGVFNLIFAILFHSPLLVAFTVILVGMYKVHQFTTITIQKGILKIGGKSIPLEEIEEVNFNGHRITLIGDNFSHSFGLLFYVNLQYIKQFSTDLKKAIVYQGTR
jgi:hypothetical protein